jgi:polyferredoxin
MRIVNARRASQVFFLALFAWFSAAATLGDRWWELRGWPVNWMLELDPLVGFATLLSTGALYAGLAWGLAVIGLTLLFGRVFCGWICPFGALHQAVGFLGRAGRPLAAKLAANRFRPAQAVKYLLLAVFIAAALRLPAPWPESASLQIGLLDPLALLHRSINLAVQPLVDRHPLPRLAEGAGLIGAVFAAALLLNLRVPRFYCRFLCPLGALLGLLGRLSIWRIGRAPEACTGCTLCERSCEGACEPAQTIRTSECVMCLNCLDDCRHAAIAYRAAPPAAGEIPLPDIGRRRLLAGGLCGLLAAPVLRLSGVAAANYDPRLVRPPGALPEAEFLARCIKCGQCMRVCPTNVIHPAGLEAGLEGLWTPRLNFRIGASGCQHTCIACGHLCPTAAIRPLSLDERLGRGRFAGRGALRIGTAFIDRGRCLPWAMDKPCIVCQENCPVSPKAIFTREVFQPVRTETPLMLAAAEGPRLRLSAEALAPERYAGGDHYALIGGERRARIAANGADWLEVSGEAGLAAAAKPGGAIAILVRLQQPVVDPQRCIGCGVCEHECPVTGLRAIRVSAENESRSPGRRMII